MVLPPLEVTPTSELLAKSLAIADLLFRAGNKKPCLAGLPSSG
jgi:hypothetical protein